MQISFTNIAMLLRVIESKTFQVQLLSDGRAMYHASIGGPGEAVEGLSCAVVDGHAGDSHYALQGEDGSLFLCKGSQARRVRGMPSSVISISCGYRHTTVAMASGVVLMLLNKKWLRVSLPSKAKRVLSGNGASGAICENGKLYTWGRNTYMQLGHTGDSVVGEVPISGSVVDAGFGSGFACALTHAGEIFAWGFGTVPRPRILRRSLRYCRLAVGAKYVAGVLEEDRRKVFMSGTVAGRPCNSLVQHQASSVSSIRGIWNSSSLVAEFDEHSPSGPCAPTSLNLRPFRWFRRRTLMLCVFREQLRRVRKRPRACADGMWSNKLPADVWYAIMKYL